jgi:YD repeat-containing protein
VTYTYDAVGNRTAMTDANSHTTTYTYDALNRLVSVTDPLSDTVAYAYDAVGNRTDRTKADGTVISYDYDALDRLADITAPGLSIGYAYDAVGNRTTMTDTVGVTSYTYDDLNRLTQAAGPNGTLSYNYDLNDNRASLTYPDSKVITYTYDLADRLTTVTDWDSRIAAYTYDDANRQTAVQYPNNTQATYTYDDADRLLSIVHTSSVSGTIAVFTYTPDAVGNRLTMQDLNSTTTYAYDDLYRLTQVTYPDGETVTYAYDAMGNRTAMTSTISGAVTYTYDVADRLLSISDGTTFTWDANGNTSIISSPIIHQSRAFVKLLPGEGVVRGQGVVGAGTDGAPRVVALGDGLLAIGTVAHAGTSQVVAEQVVQRVTLSHGYPPATQGIVLHCRAPLPPTRCHRHDVRDVNDIVAVKVVEGIPARISVGRAPSGHHQHDVHHVDQAVAVQVLLGDVLLVVGAHVDNGVGHCVPLHPPTVAVVGECCHTTSDGVGYRLQTVFGVVVQGEVMPSTVRLIMLLPQLQPMPPPLDMPRRHHSRRRLGSRSLSKLMRFAIQERTRAAAKSRHKVHHSLYCASACCPWASDFSDCRSACCRSSLSRRCFLSFSLNYRLNCSNSSRLR